MRKVRNYHWKNVVANQKARTELMFIPRTLEDLVYIVHKAEKNNKRIRALGSSHSWSDVAVTDHYLVKTHKISGFLKLDKRQLKSSVNSDGLVEVKGGTSVRDFNKGLDKRKRAIINMGGIDHQTLAGAISTSTHGSGRNLPSLPGMVKSVTIVTEGGAVKQIEPTDGITDPAKFNRNNVELIQDDQTFYSVVVGFGAMGVVYSFIVETRPEYWIRETRKIYKWPQVKQWILSGDIHYKKDSLNGGADNKKELRAVFVRVNPYVVKDNKERSAMLIEHEELTKKPARRTIGQRTRVIWSSILGGIPIITPAIILASMKLNPKGIPNNIESSFKSSQDKEYTARAHKVLFLGQIQMKEKGIDTEFAFPSQNNQKLVDVMEDLFNEATIMEEKYDKKIYHSSPVGMRWVMSSPHYMSPEYKQDVVYIDTPNHSRTHGMQTVLNHYQEIQFKHGGIPHWGKVHNMVSEDYLKEFRQKDCFKKWREIFRKFNTLGTFDNVFTKRMGM